MKQTLFASVCFCILRAAPLCAADESPPFKELLNMMSEQYQSGSFVWNVRQTLTFTKDEFQGGIAQSEAAARRAPEGPTKETQNDNKKYLETLGGKALE